MASSTPPFTLARATPADMPELITLMYHCFDNMIREVVMGCASEADLPRVIAHFEEEYKKSYHSTWLKIIDNATGKIVAATLWEIYPNAGSPAGCEGAPKPWLEVGSPTWNKAKGFKDVMIAARRQAMKGGFVHLHICFTHPDFRRMGAGGLMMEWGTGLADMMGLPCWVEASADGKPLYKIHGWVEWETPAGYPGTLMLRDAKELSRQGGHVKV